MSDIKWIKVITDIFEDEKIKLIKSMPEGRTLVLIWFQLLMQAGKTNASGWIYLSEGCGYTPAMFATLFNESQQMVELALNLFSSKPFELIEMSRDGMLYIPNWEKHQNVEGMDKIRERERLRKAKQRERKKLTENVNLPPLSLGQGGTSHGTSHQSPTTEIEEELEVDIDKEKIKHIVDLPSTPRTKRFISPTLEEVQAYCDERQTGVDANRWFNHYTSNGWKVGKNAMKDWKAAVRTWEQKQTSNGGNTSGITRGHPKSDYAGIEFGF